MKIYDNIMNIKNCAWLKEHACQISEEYDENWQSYKGWKLYKKAVFIGYVPCKKAYFLKYLFCFW